MPTVIFLALDGRGRLRALAARTVPGEEPLPIPWYPLPPLLFLVPDRGPGRAHDLDKPRHAAIGLGVVLLGLPVYHLVFARRTTNRHSARCLGRQPSSVRDRRGADVNRLSRSYHDL